MPNPPNVTGVTPGTGPVTGNMPVMISGTDFLGATLVEFGTMPAPFSVVSATQIMAYSPAQAQPCAVHVRVTTALGQSPITAADQFTYFNATPTVTGINPNQGPESGGTQVVLYGDNFMNISKVEFDGTPAVFQVNSPTQITATAPPHAAGNTNVIVTNSSGQNSAAIKYKYVSGVPTVLSVFPISGRPGDLVTIAGTNFINLHRVDFNPLPTPAAFTVISPTQITATAPGPAPAGTVTHLRVTNISGTSAGAAGDVFTYT